tara:strand:+ start:155 stop:553 length:399 start_codon:yes stop_codon:yes gene_type:complete
MLNITKKIEYSLIAIRHISKDDKKDISSAKEISSMYNVPHEIMAKTMQKLCRLGYLGAIKGSHGGYFLKKSLDEINLIDFMESLEGPIGIVKCSIDEHCNLTEVCNIKTPIQRVNENIRNVLSNISINEVII